MSRFAVPIVLLGWMLGLAFGCDWQGPVIALVLGVATVIQGVGTVRFWREHHRRLW